MQGYQNLEVLPVFKLKTVKEKCCKCGIEVDVTRDNLFIVGLGEGLKRLVFCVKHKIEYTAIIKEIVELKSRKVGDFINEKVPVA